MRNPNRQHERARENSPFPDQITFEINFIAAATSRNPIATLIEFIQPPARGRVETSCGASARTKNGSAKTLEKASIPSIGNCHAPFDAETRIVPTNGDVQVKDRQRKSQSHQQCADNSASFAFFAARQIVEFCQNSGRNRDFIRAEKIKREKQENAGN